MNQSIRSNTFETNSSSIHSLVIFKDKKSVKDLKEYNYLVPIFDGWDSFYLCDPEDILSYLYTMGLSSHTWKLVDNLKEMFPNCIFQKPSWELPYESETGCCDDRTIISFCNLTSDFKTHFYGNDLDEISDKENLFNIIFNGEIYAHQDMGYGYCVIDNHKVNAEHVYDVAVTEWVSKNIEKIWEE